MQNNPVVIVLAAGKGERFLASGGAVHKLEASLSGVSVLDRVLQAVIASGLTMHIVRHSPGQGGMADSIAAGVRTTADAPGWLILPGDLPLIQSASLKRVADGLLTNKVVVPTFGQRQGHPVGFRRECFDALVRLSGEEGARSVIKTYRHMDQVLDLPLDDVGLVTDVDTLDDLSSAEKIFARHVDGQNSGQKD